MKRMTTDGRVADATFVVVEGEFTQIGVPVGDVTPLAGIARGVVPEAQSLQWQVQME